MDRNTVIGFIIIGIVLMVWMYLNAPPPPQTPSGMGIDTVRTGQVSPDTVRQEIPVPVVPRSSEDTLGTFFSRLAGGKEAFIEVETPLYRARLSTRGGAVQMWELLQFKTWNQYPVKLVNATEGGDLNILFYSSDGKLINTKSLTFKIDPPFTRRIALTENDTAVVVMTMRVEGAGTIVKRYVFNGRSYSFDLSLEFERMERAISNFEYQISWEAGLPYAEGNSVDESGYAKALAYAGGELAELDASTPNQRDTMNISGRVSWVATRNKYFAVSIIPRGESKGAYLEGIGIAQPNNGAYESYSLALNMPYKAQTRQSDRFTVFMGPLDFDVVRGLNVELEKMMSLGAVWIIRPISEYVIIPLFQFLKLFIPNYGFVLIIFSIIIKIALHPLTKTSMKSMQRMQALQPMMTEIREKYKDDPQKMNQQIMRLYKEYGVNPAGGCLPLLLQLPILYALWAVFGSAIELRQASFIWWITDLSIPDVIMVLPFHIPIFSISKLSGLALLMGITMFIQQKMTVKDPRQKMMVYIMPLLMTMLFNNFPAGLNLYYFIFNLLSIGQQAWINKQHKDEPLKKVEQKKKSGGIMSRLTKDLPKMKR